jgi:uncharacterized protein
MIFSTALARSFLAHALRTLSQSTLLVLTTLIKAYQGVKQHCKVICPPVCRFYPSCSHYTCQALNQHGLAKGLWLSVKRMSKCHPLHPGGIDLVPDLKVPELKVPNLKT